MSGALDIRAAEKLVLRCSDEEIDLRLFSQGAGPAQVLMPTKAGLKLPLAMLPALIDLLQTAEAARQAGLIGGGK